MYRLFLTLIAFQCFLGIGQELSFQVGALRENIRWDEVLLPSKLKNRIQEQYNEAALFHGSKFRSQVSCSSMDRCLEDLEQYAKTKHSFPLARLQWTVFSYVTIRNEMKRTGIPKIEHIKFSDSQKSSIFNRDVSTASRLETIGEALQFHLATHQAKPVLQAIQNDLAKFQLWLIETKFDGYNWLSWNGVCEGWIDCRDSLDEYIQKTNLSYWYNPTLGQRKERASYLFAAIEAIETMSQHLSVLATRPVPESEIRAAATLKRLPNCDQLAKEAKYEVIEDNVMSEFDVGNGRVRTRSLKDPGPKLRSYSNPYGLLVEEAKRTERVQFHSFVRRPYGGCFAQGTPILVKEANNEIKTISIDQIRPGDRVLSAFIDEQGQPGKVCWDRVTYTYERYLEPTTDEVYRIESENQVTLGATPGHPFLTFDDKGRRRWKKTSELETTDRLLSLSAALEGRIDGPMISSRTPTELNDPVWLRGLESAHMVYNLTTEVTHRYFIGRFKSAVFTHNVK